MDAHRALNRRKRWFPAWAVIIFNFFEDSTADFSDWVAMLKAHELDLSQSRLGHKDRGTLSQRTTDPAEIMQLCEELKLFYVALTRGVRRCHRAIIYGEFL